MWLLYAEAFGAMLILIVIVWWTMFHGRHNGERRPKPPLIPSAQRHPQEKAPPDSRAQAGPPDDR